MCGISAVVGASGERTVPNMVLSLAHRGPDATGTMTANDVTLGHDRLSIIDLSDAGRQPMTSADALLSVVLNGEIYNYRELRTELSDYDFRTRTDTEVVLAAYLRWGAACLERFLGMFALIIWDARDRTLFAARDRFGVKPLYMATLPDGAFALASEIKALHVAGVPAEPDITTWASYLVSGASDGERTSWVGVRALPAGHTLTMRDGEARIERWYDVADASFELDQREEDVVAGEYLELLEDSVRLRFRADVSVGINLSGGLDSSTLLGLVQKTQGAGSDVTAFTFVTGDANYDEDEWVRLMLTTTKHPWVACMLNADEVPALAADVAWFQDEPFGGVPTLAYAKVFEQAKSHGVTVLLDGQGMDEQWAGYDYYSRLSAGSSTPIVQGSSDRPLRPDCLMADFARMAEVPSYRTPFGDALRDTQYRDLNWTKIPRALRYNDRISMRASTELREPFLDHRLVELALRQPSDRKIRGGVSKWLLRSIASDLIPGGVVDAPKRPVQTPQREWLRGPLRAWASEQIGSALDVFGGHWFDADGVRSEWDRFCAGDSDNSYYAWQWINTGLLLGSGARSRAEVSA